MSSSKAKSPKASASPRGSKDEGGDDGKKESKTPYKTDARADAMMKEAEKKLSKSSILSVFSSANKYEDAIELILKAAAQYKVGKNWQEAGDAYVKAGEIYEKNLKEDHDATTRYVEAARAYKNVDTEAAIKYYSIAVDKHMEGNRFSTAAKLYKDIAELYERDMNHKGALGAYTKAADCQHRTAHNHNSSSGRGKARLSGLTGYSYQLHRVIDDKALPRVAHSLRLAAIRSAHCHFHLSLLLRASARRLRRGGQQRQRDELLGEGGRTER